MGNKIKFDCLFLVCDKVIGIDIIVIVDFQIFVFFEVNIVLNVKRLFVIGWRLNKRGKFFCENEFVEVCVKMIYGLLVFNFFIVNDLVILYNYFFIVCFCFDFQIDFINRIKIMVLLVLLVGDDNIDYVINFMV